MTPMIKRILKLAEDNERVVIVDPETERAFVILPLSTYERLVDSEEVEDMGDMEDELEDFDDEWVSPLSTPQPLTEQNLIDSIDRDIAAWKAAQEQAAEEPAQASAGAGAEPMSAAGLDELTLTPVPGDEAQITPPASAEEEKFYIEPVA